MKRTIILLCSLLIVSCTSNNDFHQYDRFIKEIDNDNKITTNIPFDINVYIDKIIEQEVIYRVVIDNPKNDIKNIKVIATHNHETNDIYPTSGIFEDPLHLVPDKIDLDNNYAKGIILTGYINNNTDLEDINIIIKVLLKYEEDGKEKKVYYEYHK